MFVLPFEVGRRVKTSPAPNKENTSNERDSRYQERRLLLMPCLKVLFQSPDPFRKEILRTVRFEFLRTSIPSSFRIWCFCLVHFAVTLKWSQSFINVTVVMARIEDHVPMKKHHRADAVHRCFYGVWGRLGCGVEKRHSCFCCPMCPLARRPASSSQTFSCLGVGSSCSGKREPHPLFVGCQTT